uniref:Uncharacterized protein n=2 Tax=Caenorhabditis japonica TaxID=281687 RepID=A0A8R1DKU7_CAEJA
MSAAPPQSGEPADAAKNRRDSTSSCGASTYTVQEKTGHGETFLTIIGRSEQPNRELTCITMSAAESMALIFPNWVRICYRRGPVEYQPYDMNMPPRLIPRKPLHYKFDPPLTERGQIMAETYGRSLAASDVKPFEIYCAPDMKSVQTAAYLYKGLGVSYTTINIEPALMPYRQLLPANYQEMLLSPKVFFGHGYPINTQYVPYQGFFGSETIDDFSTRVLNFYKDRIVKIEQKHVIVIADASVVEMTNNSHIDTVDDIFKCTRKPTCQMSAIWIKQGEATLFEPPVLPFTRSLYASKPQYWQEVPAKLSAPNHPDIVT